MPPPSPIVLLKATNYIGSGIWYDESSNSNNAIKDTGIIAKNSKGNGIILNGTTSWILPDINLANSWTVSVWYKNKGAQNGTGACIITQITNPGINMAIGDIINNGENDGYFQGGFNRSGSGWASGTSFRLVYDEWTNIQVTWDETNLVTYINGVLLGTEQPGFLPEDSNREYRIGRRWDGDSYMVGEIGEVSIYNQALTEIQVIDSYNLSSPTFNDNAENCKPEIVSDRINKNVLEQKINTTIYGFVQKHNEDNITNPYKYSSYAEYMQNKFGTIQRLPRC